MKVSLKLLLIFLNVATLVFLSGNTILAENETGTPKESPANEATFQPPQFDGPLFLELTLPKSRFYLGERIPVKIVLYVKDLEVNVVDEPVLSQPEFLFDKLRNPIQRQLKFNRQSYQVIEFAYLLTPVKTGAISLGPVKQNCYFTPEGVSKRRIIEATTSGRNVQVLPLPKAPANFSGGIGNFQLSLSPIPRRVLQGEPITVKMTLSGYGSLQSVSAPILDNSSGLKVFNAQKKTAGPSANSLWQQVLFEQVIIPTDFKVKRIGPYTFTYFDPGSGRYKQLHSSPIVITVKPNPDFKNDRAPESRPLSESIKPIKADSGALKLKTRPLLHQVRFWLLQTLPLLILAGAIVHRRYRELFESDSPKARAIRASMKAKQQLAAAQDLLRKGCYSDLLDELLLIFREYLGERFAIPSAGMTGAIIKDLEGKGVPPEALKNIRLIFEQYDLHHFAGSKLNPEEAAKLWETITRTIEFLRSS